MRRMLAWLMGAVVVLGGVGLLLLRVPAVQDVLVRRMVARAVADTADRLFAPDALRVALCGTSAPLPHPRRAKACTAALAEKAPLRPSGSDLPVMLTIRPHFLAII